MKTYENLVRFIELNDDGSQSCLNTTFTQDQKRENEALIIKSIKQPNYMQNMYGVKKEW
jgi:hypothetical protein